jgi:hypothetical protein
MLIAHSINAQGKRHDLIEHLRSVATLAAAFASKFAGGDLGYWVQARLLARVLRGDMEDYVPFLQR